MTIYVDDMFDGQGAGWRKGRWCHMWSDTDDSELLGFASDIGLQPRYFQTKNDRFHHFDLRASKRELALKKGAVHMPLTRWIMCQKDKTPMPPEEKKTVTVYMPIGELLERGMTDVFSIRVNGRGSGIIRPFKNVMNGNIVCTEYLGEGGTYEVKPDTIAEVDFYSPSVFEKKARDIHDLIAKYAKDSSQ